MPDSHKLRTNFYKFPDEKLSDLHVAHVTKRTYLLPRGSGSLEPSPYTKSSFMPSKVVTPFGDTAILVIPSGTPIKPYLRINP